MSEDVDTAQLFSRHRTSTSATQPGRGRSAPTSPNTSPSFYRRKEEKSETIAQYAEKVMRAVTSEGYELACEQARICTVRRLASSRSGSPKMTRGAPDAFLMRLQQAEDADAQAQRELLASS